MDQPLLHQPSTPPHALPPGPADAPAPPRRRSALPWLLVLAGALLAVGAFLWLRHRGAASAKASAAAAASASARPVSVTAAPAERRDVPLYAEGVGNAVPIQQVTVRAQVEGPLEKVFFTEGQRVKKGDPLAQIDPRPFQIQLHQAQANYAKDFAASNNAKLNLARYIEMQREGIGTQQQVDDQRALAEQTTATLSADLAQIENAKLNLTYAHIVSPLDGVTGIRQVDPGNLVHLNDVNGIVVVTQVDPMALVFSLPQDDLERVHAALSAGTVEVDAFSRDGASKLGSGTLELVDNQINQATATLRLKAIVPNADGKLWPNQFVKARVLLAVRKGATCVPSVAIQHGPQGAFVYVVGPEQTVAPRPVVIETTQGELTIVGEGVAPGDVVVTDGANQLRPGSKVSVKAPQRGGLTKPKPAAPPEPPPTPSSAPPASARGAPR
ncbi:MAG TPA: efflux RND transporter periplasmic adaptor subunit [Minicystis sp.]|nr:efflux RND transporter periplasmic adaptor subunit [Minicystis sp.]